MAEGGQLTPGQPDRDTESIVDPATGSLEVGDIQSVNVESDQQCKLPSSTELWKCVEVTTLVGSWAGQATCEDQSAEKLGGSGAASAPCHTMLGAKHAPSNSGTGKT